MKSIFKDLFVLSIASTLILSSCQLPVITTDSSLTQRETTTFGSKKVILMSGVASGNLGLSLDETANRLLATTSIATGRSADATSVTSVSENTMADILAESVWQASLPNFDNPTQADLDRIKSDFPGITEEQIASDWLEIRGIYLQQLSAIALGNTLETISDPTSRSLSRATYYGNTFPTIQELAAMIGFPLSAVNLSRSRDLAFSLTQGYLNTSPDNTNEKSDAFRHSVWTQMLAKTGWGLKRERYLWALSFSNAHEQGRNYNGSGPLSSPMDLHNNLTGIINYLETANPTYSEIRIFWWTVARWESGVSEPSNDQIASAMRTRLKSAVLVDKSAYSEPAGQNAMNAAGPKTLVYIDPDSKVYP